MQMDRLLRIHELQTVIIKNVKKKKRDDMTKAMNEMVNLIAEHASELTSTMFMKRIDQIKEEKDERKTS